MSTSLATPPLAFDGIIRPVSGDPIRWDALLPSDRKSVV